jgi:hypothetical protein
MGGGLINIISGGSDLYLTGLPQITFYKMVYRRYTHFASESIKCEFDDNVQFDSEMKLTPQRIGDLIYKSYLHIVIPEINITKINVGIDYVLPTFNNYIVDNYQKMKTIYMKILSDIYRIIYNSINTSNVTYTDILNDCTEYITNNNVYDTLQEYNNLLTYTREHANDIYSHILNKNNSNLWYILQTIYTNIDNINIIAKDVIDKQIFIEGTPEYNREIQRLIKQCIFKEINIGFEYCKLVQKYFSEQYNNYISNKANNNIRCAWVKNLGHSIIEYIDIVIGGNRIDRHWGIWINIWHQLTYKTTQNKIYDELIGNVPQLTDFNNNEKPKYELFIPLTFWFNKFNGNAFPLVAMQYNDLNIYVKLRKFEEVFYIERIYSGIINGNNAILTAPMIDTIIKSNIEISNIVQITDVNLTNIWNMKGKQLYGNILMDYIYLNHDERKRFAQSSHEYLIENIQTNIFENIYNSKFDARLDFVNPSKEIIWVLSKSCLINNNYSNECKWYDHTLHFGHTNPIINTSISFNNYVRVSKQSGLYFNKYQPYTYHKVSPDDGINMYSFSLEPLQHQPSGTCNFSRLGDVKLYLDINEEYFYYTDQQIYNHDLDINFNIVIEEPQELIDKIDIKYAKRLVEENNNNNAIITINIYEQLVNNNNIISLENYRKILFKTNAICNVYSLSVNILRLIGGYGALAYTSNS